MNSDARLFNLLTRLAVALMLLAFALAAGIALAHAAEIIPSVGLSKSINGDDTNPSAGLALRGQLAPMLATEVGVQYRSESRDNDLLRVKMWPITTSLWLTPIPALYAGAGVGWYNMSFQYSDAVVPPLENHTEQDFGVHVGGGVRVPVTPAAALDLNGRYVMLRDQEDRLVPQHFDPDFWNMSLGLALHF